MKSTTQTLSPKTAIQTLIEPLQEQRTLDFNQFTKLIQKRKKFPTQNQLISYKKEMIERVKQGNTLNPKVKYNPITNSYDVIDGYVTLLTHKLLDIDPTIDILN